jgi:Zinc dependent phospholipase C
MALTILLTFTLMLLWPGHAWAWGIGFHLQIGTGILDGIRQIAPQLESCLKAFPYDYLYGCIAADITLGKKFTHYLQHCHSWRVAKQVIAAAEDDAQRACAYGYLSHLAMDVVAHSYFVPYKMVRTFSTMTLKHTYWEIRMEAEVDPSTWSLARTIARKDFSHNDAMLRGVIADTIFSFDTNKRLFNSILMLNRLQQWQKLLRSLNRGSKWVLDAEDQREYVQLAREVTESILRDMEASPYWKADPAGERALHAAKMIRKNLYLLWLDGKLPEEEAAGILADLRPRFREGITAPERLLELLSAI